MLEVKFYMTTAADAQQAADICDYIASILGDDVSQGNTAVTRTRRPRQPKAPAPVSGDTLAATYNALATAAGSPTIESQTVSEPLTETAPPAAATVAEEVAKVETGDAVKSRDEMMAEARALQVRLGVLWVREHGSMKYGKAKLSEVTDADLASIVAAATAAVAGLA